MFRVEFSEFRCCIKFTLRLHEVRRHIFPSVFSKSTRFDLYVLARSAGLQHGDAFAWAVELLTGCAALHLIASRTGGVGVDMVVQVEGVVRFAH